MTSEPVHPPANPRLAAGTARDPIVVTGSGPADVIALAWYQMGYRPTDSLVLVGIDPGTGRIGRVARMDFPPRAGAEHRRQVVAALCEPLGLGRSPGPGRPDATVLAIVFGEGVFGAAAHTAGGFGPPRVLAALIADVLGGAGATVADVLGVSAGGWRSLRCSDASCCPAEGRPLSEVEGSAAAAAHVVLGAELVPDEADLVRDVQPSGPVPGRAPGRALGPAGHRRALNPASRRLQWLVWERAFESGAISDGRAAALAPYLADPYLRDAVVVCALGGDRDAVLTSLRQSGAPVPGPYPIDLFGVTRTPPDEPEQAARAERARAVLATAARTAAPGERGDALAVLALIAWYRNQAARARLLVAAAQADRPGQTLAALVDDLLIALVPPPWVGETGERDESAHVPASGCGRARDTSWKYS